MNFKEKTQTAFHLDITPIVDTVFNLLMGEFYQDSGSIQYAGKDITRTKKYVRVNMGLSRTNQIPHAFTELNVFDNIRIGGIANTLKVVFDRRSTFSEAEDIANRVGLKDDLDKLPGELSLAKTKKRSWPEPWRPNRSCYSSMKFSPAFHRSSLRSCPACS